MQIFLLVVGLLCIGTFVHCMSVAVIDDDPPYTLPTMIVSAAGIIVMGVSTYT